MLGRLRDTLRGARRIEILLVVILIALAGLIMADKGAGMQTNHETLLEARLQEVLSCIDGVEAPEVMVTEDESGEVFGVVVVAGCDGDMYTRLNIQNAIKTLLKVDLSKIEIIDRKQRVF